MSTEQNKVTANRVPMEFSKGNVNILDQVVDRKALTRVRPGMPNTLESTKKLTSRAGSPRSPISPTNEDTIAEGDLVTERVTRAGQ